MRFSGSLRSWGVGFGVKMFSEEAPEFSVEWYEKSGIWALILARALDLYWM